MASQAQEVAFIQTYANLAEQAAKQLHIDPNLCLAQWALESDWGTASYVPKTHNLAGIMKGNSIWSFPSWQDFLNVYVTSMRNDCPAIRNGRTDVSTPTSVVFAGNRYNTVNPDYAKTVDAIRQQIAQLQGRNTTSSTSTSTEAKPVVTLQKGAMGSEVKTLQEDLNKTGAKLVVDGVFGPETEKAVKKFQASHQLAQDGIVGPKTWSALESAVKSASSGSTKKVEKVVVYFTDGSSETIS